mgnify:CR=1 FL=1
MIGCGLRAVGDAKRFGDALAERDAHVFGVSVLFANIGIGAASVGAWAEGAFLLFLFALANALEEYALDRARSAIRNLADLAPAQARLLRDGVEVEIPVEQVRIGDVLVVRPAERLPADGTVRTGGAARHKGRGRGDAGLEEGARGGCGCAGASARPGCAAVEARCSGPPEGAGPAAPIGGWSPRPGCR